MLTHHSYTSYDDRGDYIENGDMWTEEAAAIVADDTGADPSRVKVRAVRDLGRDAAAIKEDPYNFTTHYEIDYELV